MVLFFSGGFVVVFLVEIGSVDCSKFLDVFAVLLVGEFAVRSMLVVLMCFCFL